MPDPMPPMPPLIRLGALATSGLVLVSAVAGALAAIAVGIGVAGQPHAWTMFGFEAVTALAGLLGIQLARGRHGSGPALGLVCIAGTIFVAGVLGWQSAGRQLGGVSLTPLLGFRVLAAGALGALAAAAALARSARSRRLFGLGVGLSLPALVLAGLMVLPGPRTAIAGFLSGGIVGALLAVLAFLVLGGLLCASAHLVIRAFELARPEASGPPGAERR